MPPKKAGEYRKCSSRNTIAFQTYVNQLKKDEPDKIKNLLARALMNEDELMKFDGHVDANECVFSYPDSDWHSVYLIDENGEPYWDRKGSGAAKYYFKLNFRLDKKGLAVDAEIADSTTKTPAELMKDGKEIGNCSLTASGKCGNPKRPGSGKASKKEAEDSDEEEAGIVSEDVKQHIQKIQVGTKTKMPRDFFEGLGSKALIIDWMLANMNPDDIMKCIQRGSLTQDEIKKAQQVVGSGGSAGPSSGAGPSGMSTGDMSAINMALNQYSALEINGMLKSVTKSELVNVLKQTKDASRKKENLVMLCKRSGITKYTSKKSEKSGKVFVYDENGDIIDDLDPVLDECAEREALRIRKILKLYSISAAYRKGKYSKADLMVYPGVLPWDARDSIKKHFPLVKNLKNEAGQLYGQIPSSVEGSKVSYFKYDDILGKDLKKLNTLLGGSETESVTKQDILDYKGGSERLPWSMKDYVKLYFPLVKNMKNESGDLYGQIPSGKDSDGKVIYYKYDDILGKDLRKYDAKKQSGEVSFGKKRKTIKRKLK